MSRYAPNGFYTNGFSSIRNGANRRQVALDSEVTSYAGIADATLAEVALDDEDLTEGAGVVSGRRLTVAQFADVPVTQPGEATHVAIVDDDADEVLYVTVCSTLELNENGTVTFPSWGIEIRAPAAS